jgi:hypothetical protein
MSDDAFAHMPPTVAAGRAAVVARLRALATRLEQLPLAAAAVLVLVEPGTPEKVACHPKSSTRFSHPC